MADLHKDGFIGPFELDQVKLVERLIRQLDVAGNQFKNFHIRSETCRRLLSSEHIVNSVDEHFGQNLSLWRSNSFKKTDGSGEVEWHHDRHFETEDSAIDYSNLNDHFSILVALTDMDEASGIMEFIPGSHLPDADYQRDTRPFHLRPAEDHFLEVPDSLVSKKVQVPLKKGQFLLFHSGLLHRSLPAQGVGVHRYSLVARLCKSETIIPKALAVAEEIQTFPYRFDMAKKFVDQNFLVTGGSRGIGKAIALGLLKEGAKVLITGRNKTVLEETSQWLGQESGNKKNISCLAADAVILEDMKQVLNHITEKFGALDGVFVNAATNQPSGSILDLSEEQWLEHVFVNVKSTYHTCKLAAQNMTVYGGNIVILGSGIGHEGCANNSAYAASKAVNWSLTQSLAKELSQWKINVNELIPGPVITDMNPGASGPTWKRPQDVVETALNLANQDKKYGATGQSWSLKRMAM